MVAINAVAFTELNKSPLGDHSLLISRECGEPPGVRVGDQAERRDSPKREHEQVVDDADDVERVRSNAQTNQPGRTRAEDECKNGSPLDVSLSDRPESNREHAAGETSDSTEHRGRRRGCEADPNDLQAGAHRSGAAHDAGGDKQGDQDATGHVRHGTPAWGPRYEPWLSLASPAKRRSVDPNAAMRSLAKTRSCINDLPRMSRQNSVIQATARMRKPFVVISGLPGSGKTTLGRRLVPVLNLPLIDKDDILDRLFELKGIGDIAWRRTLSRESDRILQNEATNSNGAILASFWHVPGMPSGSGTRTDWLGAPSHHVVNVHCVCDVEVAANRFLQRQRHPGHLDRESSAASVLVSLRTLTQLPLLDLGPRIDVDTSHEPRVGDVVRAIRDVLELVP